MSCSLLQVANPVLNLKMGRVAPFLDYYYARFEILMAETVKFTALWVVVLYTLVDHCCFKVQYYLHSSPYSFWFAQDPSLVLPLYPSIFPHFTYSSTLKLKAACYSEILVMVYRTPRCHIPEDSNLHF
jgi:hypothetical protein